MILWCKLCSDESTRSFTRRVSETVWTNQRNCQRLPERAGLARDYSYRKRPRDRAHLSQRIARNGNGGRSDQRIGGGRAALASTERAIFWVRSGLRGTGGSRGGPVVQRVESECYGVAIVAGGCDDRENGGELAGARHWLQRFWRHADRRRISGKPYGAGDGAGDESSRE